MIRTRQLRAALTGLVALAVIASWVGAQSIKGRVVDAFGNRVEHVRILVHPRGDSTETATRVAISNARGEFRVAFDHAGSYVVRVRRIGFAAEPDQMAIVEPKGETQLSITLHAVAMSLVPVTVTEAIHAKCVAIEDPAQNARAREWLEHAVYQLQTRRVVERDYVYTVHATTTRNPPRSSDVPRSYRHVVGERTIGEDDAANLVGVGRAVVHRADDIMPTETTLLFSFLRTHCFVNKLEQNADLTWTIRFRDTTEYDKKLTIAGALTFADNGSYIARAVFDFSIGGKVMATAALAFDTVEIGGESYPILHARSIAQRQGPQRSRASSIEERFTYSAFAKGR